MRRPARIAFLAAALVASGCRCSDPSSPLVQDFEGRVSLTKWPKETPGDIDRSREWASDGERSLRVDPGLLASTDSLLRTSFRGFDALRVHVHNPSDRLTTIGFELQDDHATLYDRHRSAFGAPPGDSVIDVDISGDLWRGEENRPFRGPTKTPLDLGKITRIGFENRGDKPIYIDGLTLVADPFEAPPGAVAFDFGRRGTRVMGKTKGVFEDTEYDPSRGFGFVAGTGKPSFLKSAAAYPSPLLGDGLAWEGAQFAADLTGGPTLGWIAFERAGFWESEFDATGYTEAVLSANGAEVHRHTFSPSGPHFFFEDLEITTMADAWPKLVRPAHAIATFSFVAKPGQNTFTLAVNDRRGPPLRVAGLFLAPDTPAGHAYLDALEERQKRAFESVFPPTERARRPPGSVPVSERLLVQPRPVGEVAHPRDLPDSAPPNPPVATTVPGHKAYVQLALHAARQVDVSIAATSGAAASPGAAPKAPAVGDSVPRVPSPTDNAPGASAVAARALQVSPPRVSYGVYGPKRPYEGGAAWIETAYYRPVEEAATVHVGPELTRSVLLEFDVPASAPAGRTVFVVRFSAGPDVLAEVPVTVDIVNAALPPLPIPVGLFMSALPFAPDAVGEERWWQLQEAVLAAEGEAGLNTPTGGPGLDYTMTKTPDGYTFTGDRALRYLDLAQRHGLGAAVVGYSGFLPSIKHERPDAARFQQSWSAFETAHKLPPHYLYAYDEPSTDEELAETATYLGPFHTAGVRTIGFFSGAEGPRFRPVLDATFAPAVSGHTPDLLRAWVDEGKHVFLYNRGVSRLAMGADLVTQIHFRVSGRLEWIGLYTQGFAFDDLDAREPSYGMFVVHDKLGVLPTPRWLSLREGLFDARVRLALEKVAAQTTPGPSTGPTDYPADPAKWPDATLETTRVDALRRLSALRAP